MLNYGHEIKPITIIAVRITCIWFAHVPFHSRLFWFSVSVCDHITWTSLEFQDSGRTLGVLVYDWCWVSRKAQQFKLKVTTTTAQRISIVHQGNRHGDGRRHGHAMDIARTISDDNTRHDDDRRRGGKKKQKKHEPHNTRQNDELRYSSGTPSIRCSYGT